MENQLKKGSFGVLNSIKKMNPLYIIFVIGMLLVVTSLFGIYKWYQAKQEKAAYTVFVNSLEEYKRLTADAATIDQVALLVFADRLEKEIQTYHAVPVAHYLIKLQVAALAAAGKKDEALQKLEHSLLVMRDTDPLYFLFKTEYAILLLDSGDASVREKGIQLLQEIAHNKGNAYTELALFYLGRYYWVTNETEKARTVWQELLHTQYDSLVGSVWADLASKMVEQLP